MTSCRLFRSFFNEQQRARADIPRRIRACIYMISGVCLCRSVGKHKTEARMQAKHVINNNTHLKPHTKHYGWHFVFIPNLMVILPVRCAADRLCSFTCRYGRTVDRRVRRRRFPLAFANNFHSPWSRSSSWATDFHSHAFRGTVRS